MSIFDLFRRIASGPILVATLSLALCETACSSSDSTQTGSHKGGAASKGGATNKAGAAGTAGAGGTTNATTLPVDNWVPPEVADKTCSIPADTADPTQVPFVTDIGCRADFDALAAPPLVADIPGSYAVKVVLDQADGDKLYFQNSDLYPIHWKFANAHLSVAANLPQVDALEVFNQSQYSSPERRFILGTVLYFEEPKLWALEFSAVDTATAPMIEKLFRAVKAHSFFGDALVLHPVSNLTESEIPKLSADIHYKTSEQIYANTSYLPLNLGEAVGKLVFVNAAELSTAYVGFRDIVVLDSVPNDISVVAGIITEQFQTMLSHINVLCSQRGTPNMSLRGATTNQELRALSGQTVRLTVGANGYSVKPATQAEADAWWESVKPSPITLPAADQVTTDLRDIAKVTVEEGKTLSQAITAATLTYGAKAANYSVLYNTAGIPIKPAFAIPIYYYFQFMRENGFDEYVRAMMADPEFQSSLAVQDKKLAELRLAIRDGTVNQSFQQLLYNKLKAEYPNKKMRFRTSTNAEDLAGFPCAGCYDSHSGDPKDWQELLYAIKDTWSGVWFYRTFREREYHSIDHLSVGMALLVHTNFEAEEANGVAITNNRFDKSGLNPAFTINVQYGGENEIVHMDAGITSDQFLYYFQASTQSVQWISHSNVLPAGMSAVLTDQQMFDLALALDKIHKRYNPAYGSLAGNTGWYGMDVEFKFDDEADTTKPATLYIKQARLYPPPS